MKKFKIYYILTGGGFDGRDIEVAKIQAGNLEEAKGIIINNRPKSTYVNILSAERIDQNE